MKRTVTITLEVNTDDYYNVPDTIEGTLDLVNEMLNGAADWPTNNIAIICERHMKLRTEI